MNEPLHVIFAGEEIILGCGSQATSLQAQGMKPFNKNNVKKKYQVQLTEVNENVICIAKF